MITILTGDKSNAGDALIVDRAMKLFKRVFPGEELLKLNRWEGLNGHLHQVNQTRALVLLGGAAVVRDIYPGIYPLVRPLDRIRVPIVAMGLGSNLFPYTETSIRRFRFKPQSRLLLQRLQQDRPWVSVREYTAARILHENGVPHARVTGCPAWFNLETLGTPVRAPSRIHTVAVATGVGHISHPVNGAFEQQVAVLRMVRDLFKEARALCIFQDSLEKDAFKPAEVKRRQRRLADAAISLGYHAVDCTGDSALLADTYSRVDLLVGYRVHSHVCMLSLGKPSVLIAEDSRGFAMSDFIGVACLSAQVSRDRWFYALPRSTPAARLMSRLLPVKADSDLPAKLRNRLNQHIENGFAHYGAVHKVILHYYKIMEEFVRSIVT